MDRLSYFKHVAIVALDFPTNPEARARKREGTRGEETRGENRGEGSESRESEIRALAARMRVASYLLPVLKVAYANSATAPTRVSRLSF